MSSSYSQTVLDHLVANYGRMYHEPVGQFKLPYIVPGAGYEHCLWDWDTFFASRAILAIMRLSNAPEEMRTKMLGAMRGCILNFLSFQQPSGAMPFSVYLGAEHLYPEMIEKYDEPNQHKPVIAQFTDMLAHQPGDQQWIKECLPKFDRFLTHYDESYLDRRTGLYRWRSDAVIGVDNDPCTFGRPRHASATVFLNCLMVREFDAMARLHRQHGGGRDVAEKYVARREELSAAIRRWCWDRRDRFFYSVDLQCHTDHTLPYLHHGLGVFWPCIPLRIQVWTGFMPMWAGVATAEQAADLVRLHLHNREALWCDYGIRSLAANEPMYNCDETNNPSNWLGPVWLIVNYIVFKGLLNYGFRAEAEQLCRQTVDLLGRDIERFGGMHEYYVPETGIGVMNCGFMNWNYLVAEMMEAVGWVGLDAASRK